MAVSEGVLSVTISQRTMEISQHLETTRRRLFQRSTKGLSVKIMWFCITLVRLGEVYQTIMILYAEFPIITNSYSIIYSMLITGSLAPRR